MKRRWRIDLGEASGDRKLRTGLYNKERVLSDFSATSKGIERSLKDGRVETEENSEKRAKG